MKKKIGTWITSFNQHTLEVISNSGFSWICIDLEHSDISDKETNILISLAKKNKIKPYVRVASKSEENFKKALDGGATGIIVPMVEAKEDVDDIINFSYYSPIGKRSFGLYSHNLYGIDKNHLKIQRYKPEIILQIESLKGINNLEIVLAYLKDNLNRSDLNNIAKDLSKLIQADGLISIGEINLAGLLKWKLGLDINFN